MKLIAQEEPAIYKVLRGQAGAAVQSPRAGKLREFVVPRREKVHPQDAMHLPYVGMEQVEAHTMRLLGTVEASSMKSSANRFFPWRRSLRSSPAVLEQGLPRDVRRHLFARVHRDSQNHWP